MTTDRRLEQLLGDVLADGAPSHAPERLRHHILFTTSRARSRSRWLVDIKERPMRMHDRVAAGSPAMRLAYVAILTLILVILATGTVVGAAGLLAGPATIVVAPDGSADYTTIAEAVAAAHDGDTVLIRPGTYAEQVDITGDITVKGEGDPSSVVIQVPEKGRELPPEYATRCLMSCSGTINGVYGIHLVGSNAVVSTLTVVGTGSGKAIVVDAGAPTLEDMIIDIAGDPVPSSEAASRMGLAIDLGSQALVRNVRHEGWLQVDRGSTPTFEQSQLLDSCVQIWGDETAATFRNNLVTGCPNGWSFDIAHNASALIEDNDISGGEIDVYGVGMDPVIRGNVIHDSPGGINITELAAATLDGNTFERNGRAIIADATVTSSIIRGNTFCGNDTDLDVPDGSTLTLDGNTICAGEPSSAP